MDSDLLADLLKPENKNTLTGILTFHVLSGKVMSTDISGVIEATTVNGQKLTVKNLMAMFLGYPKRYILVIHALCVITVILETKTQNFPPQSPPLKPFS